MLALTNAAGDPQLWVLGGRGGDNSFKGGPLVYFNDIWTAPISGAPTVWTKLQLANGEEAMPWAPRTGHCAVLELGTPENRYSRTLYVYGGEGPDKQIFDDLWAWRLDIAGEVWRRDYTPQALYSAGTGDALTFRNDSPAVYYVSPDSPLTALRRWWVPTKPDAATGQRYELRPYIPLNDIEVMQSQGLNTIRDLANADLYTILR